MGTEEPAPAQLPAVTQGTGAARVEAALGRGRPRSGEAHRAILDATRDLIIESGFANLRLEHVATRAGVGKATIYRRWPDTRALLAARPAT